MADPMTFDSPRRRFGRPRHGSLRAHLVAEIDALALELDEARDATSTGHAPISARADYLRAQDAHRRAQLALADAHTRAELTVVSDALRDCRTALGATRATLRR